MLFLSLIATFIACSWTADLESSAKLLASKTVENKFIVENRDLTVKYSIYNVGNSAASKITLDDDTFPKTDFTVVRGQLKVEWRSIPPNGNVTHVVILKPHSSGTFNFTSAQITYIPSEDAETQIAFTSFPGTGSIMTEIEFNRKHSPHLKTIYIMHNVDKTVDDVDCLDLAAEAFDVIKSIQDPEKYQTLEDLSVVQEDLVLVKKTRPDEFHISIEFVPTVPHCSLATLIGLCIRVKLQEYLLCNFKLDIFIKEENHQSAAEVSKQINDKERTAAAMENAELMKIVQECIKERFM